MEEIKTEEKVTETIQTNIPNPVVDVSSELEKVNETLNKVLNENKVLKDEIIKLKNANQVVVETKVEPYKVDEKLWREIF